MGKCFSVSFNNDFIREEIQYFMGLNYAASPYTFLLRSLNSLNCSVKFLELFNEVVLWVVWIQVTLDLQQ